MPIGVTEYSHAVWQKYEFGLYSKDWLLCVNDIKVVGYPVVRLGHSFLGFFIIIVRLDHNRPTILDAEGRLDVFDQIRSNSCIRVLFRTLDLV